MSIDLGPATIHLGSRGQGVAYVAPDGRSQLVYRLFGVGLNRTFIGVVTFGRVYRA